MDTKTKTKSIFSGMGGLISALAGLVTVTLGVLAIGSQVGWFDSGSKAKDTEVTTGEGAQDESGGTESGSQSGASGAASAKPSFAVDPDAVEFSPLGPSEAEVTLKNTGTAPFAAERPTLDGSGKSAFKVSDVDCLGSDVPKGGSCTVKVEFVATKAGTYNAILKIPVGDNGDAATASLKGEKLL